MRTLTSSILSLFLLLFSLDAFSRVVTYELNIENQKVNLSGKKTVDFSLTVNGGIPAPTLEFTEGDEAVITVHNKMKNEETSIHWHGILLPSEMDGVPYVTTPPIMPGKSFTFKFKLRQHGTYWYHSHTMVQEQKGVYGAIVIHPKSPTIKYDKDIVLVLSDWSDEKPEKILKNLRKDGDYYLYKKDNIRSYWGAFKSGGLSNHLSNEWMRMGGMDLSDVGYDTFLTNGKVEPQFPNIFPGESIRLRVINAAASSYFYLSLGKEVMKVISADGVDIQPIGAHEVLIGMAETYDILFNVPSAKSYEFRATAQDGTGYTSAWLGEGEKVFAPNRPLPNPYAAMKHTGNHDHMMMNHEGQGHKMDHRMHQDHANTEDMVHSLTVDDIKSPVKTSFSKKTPVHELKLVLGGNMERYVWHINGKTIAQDTVIKVNEGEIVRFKFVNETMMHHPFHLHGHFFRVLTEKGDYSPLKHTVDVGPHSRRTIEFLTNEPGEWMLHCHNLYHLKTGMGRIVKYTSYTPSKRMLEYQKEDPHLHDHVYFKSRLETSTNHAQADFHFMRTSDELETHFETREYNSLDHAEGDWFYRRWFSRFFNLIVGGTYFAEYTKNNARGVLGFGYTLPMLIETSLLVDHRGELRLDLEKRFQWTKYIFSDAEVVFRQNEKTEFEITLMYAQNWNWSAGFMLTEDSTGIGVQYQF